MAATQCPLCQLLAQLLQISSGAGYIHIIGHFVITSGGNTKGAKPKPPAVYWGYIDHREQSTSLHSVYMAKLCTTKIFTFLVS